MRNLTAARAPGASSGRGSWETDAGLDPGVEGRQRQREGDEARERFYRQSWQNVWGGDKPRHHGWLSEVWTACLENGIAINGEAEESFRGLYQGLNL